MKEKLIELLGLDAKSTEEQIVAAVANLAKASATNAAAASKENEIRALIAESGNALSRDAAVQVLADRKAHAAKHKAKK